MPLPLGVSLPLLFFLCGVITTLASSRDQKTQVGLGVAGLCVVRVSAPLFLQCDDVNDAVIFNKSQY